jgi:hypothetical protein
MHYSRSVCSLSLLIVCSYSTFLNSQQPLDQKQPKQPPANELSSASRSEPAPPRTGVSKSPLVNTPPPASPVRRAPVQETSQPESMFDALAKGLTGPVSRIEVHAVAREPGVSAPILTGGQEILSTAGSYGDFERFLQEFPGVVSTSDLSNEILVRGGHPMENLFLVDGIEIPNINHLAMPGTTGGFGPMVDSAVIQGIKFYTGGYDARYPERLSSVVEIETLDPRNLSTHAEGDVGIQGMGGLFEKQFNDSNLLASAHKGFLQYLDAAGIGGLPSYENEMVRFRRKSASGDRLTILHIGGLDSIQMTPCPKDPYSYTTIDSEYSGQRETTGIEWQQVYSTRSFGVATVSDSEQVEHMDQQDQLPNPTRPPAYKGRCPDPVPAIPPVPVYSQDSDDAFSNAGYRFEWSASQLTVSAGSAFWLERPHYRVAQPLGSFSPYSVAPVRSDSTSFTSGFSTGQSGTFAQFTFRPFRQFTLSAGGRLQTFALGNHITLTPRISLRFDPNEHVGFHVAFASYAQMPPYIYLLSYARNRAMVPMRATHEIAGIDINPGPAAQIKIEAYNKIYTDIPASTEYPAINLHNVVDTIGEQVVWLPMNSGGHGQASGIELSDLTRIGSRLVMRGSVAYSRAMFAGLDGVLRPSSYDLPWIVNFAALQRIGHGYEVSARFGYATGRPYTPFDFAHSSAQDRPIYDISRMNALRAPYFSRLDAQLDKDFKMRGVHLELYLGVDNIMNRDNFLDYVWLPDIKISKWKHVNPVYELNQMPIFPNFGLRYIFR